MSRPLTFVSESSMITKKAFFTHLAAAVSGAAATVITAKVARSVRERKITRTTSTTTVQASNVTPIAARATDYPGFGGESTAARAAFGRE